MPVPYYQDDYVTIYHGDCRDILPEIGTFDLLLTDPPYGISWDTNYSRFTNGEGSRKTPIANDNVMFNPSHLLGDHQSILWGCNNYMSMLPHASLLVWDKRSSDGTAFLSDAEVAWWSNGHGVYIKSINAQRHRALSGGLHPTQKPVSLMSWCIQKSKSKGNIIDPYMGSGSTLKAAKNLGRRAVGIEIEEKYCEIAAKRMCQEVLAL